MPPPNADNTTRDDASAPSADALQGASAAELIGELVAEISGRTPGALKQQLDTNFVTLGLDGLQLTALASAVERHFGAQITFRELMEESASIRSLAARVERTPRRAMGYHVARLGSRLVSKADKAFCQMGATPPDFSSIAAASDDHATRLEKAVPLIWAKAGGCAIVDVDGNHYLDFINDGGAALSGHGHAVIERGLRASLRQDVDELSVRVSRSLCALNGMAGAAWFSSGDDALAEVCTYCREATRQPVVAVVGYPIVPPRLGHGVLALAPDDGDLLAKLRKQSDRLACVVFEPGGCGPSDAKVRALARSLRQLADEVGFSVVVDERSSGFRLSPAGANAFFDCCADFAVYGSDVGGGFSLGTVAWSQAAKGFSAFGSVHSARCATRVPHQTALAVAASVIDWLTEEGPQLQRQLNHKTMRLGAGLATFFSEFDAGFVAESVAGHVRLRSADASGGSGLWCLHMRDRGFVVRAGAPIRLTPSHTDDQIDQFLAAAEDSLREMASDGLFGDDIACTGQPCIRLPKLPQMRRQGVFKPEGGSEKAGRSLGVLIEGKANHDDLLAAIKKTLEACEACRIVWAPDGEGLVLTRGQVHPQVIHDDLEAQQAVEQSAIVSAYVREVSFSCDSSPIEARLFTLSAHRRLIVLSVNPELVDDRSVDNLIADILSHLAGRVPVPALSYERFAVSSAIRRDAAFWAAKFEGWVRTEKPASESLPTLADSEAVLPSSVVEDLYQTARAKRVGLNVIAVAALALVLQKLTGRQSFVIGLRQSEQELIGQRTVGATTLIVPVLIEITPSTPVERFLDQVSVEVDEATRRQAPCFSQLFRLLGAREEFGASHFFDAILNLRERQPLPEVAGVSTEILELTPSAPSDVLTLSMLYGPSECVVEAASAWEGGSEPSVDLAECFVATISNLCIDEKRSVDGLPLVRQEMERALLAALAGPPHTSDDVVVTVCDLFREQVMRTPASVACRQGEEELTYAELDTKARRIAAYLMAHGYGEANCVGLLMSRELASIAAIVGIWMTGASIVLLDETAPSAWNSEVALAAQTDAILCDDTHRDQFDPARLLSWRDAAGFDPIPVERLPLINPAHAAYLLHPSACDEPVADRWISHGDLVGNTLAYLETGNAAAARHFLVASALAQDNTLAALCLPLVSGCTLILSRETEYDRPDTAVSLITTTMPDVVLAPLAFWRAVAAGAKSNLGGVTGFCAEIVPRTLAQGLAERGVALYAPLVSGRATDTGFVSGTTYPDEIDFRVARGVQALILHASGHLCPPGVEGELYLTASGSVTPARRQHERANLMEVGWTAVYDEEGRVFLRNQTDKVVYRGGHALDLSSLERRVCAHPQIDDASLAVCKPDQPGDPEQLVADVCFSSDEPITSNELRIWLHARLPRYMIPDRITVRHSSVRSKFQHLSLVASDSQVPAKEGQTAIFSLVKKDRKLLG